MSDDRARPAGEEEPRGGLVRHSFVYSLVPLFRYAVSFGMTRFYTHPSRLIAALYGVKEMVDLWMLLMQQLLGQNLLSGMVRFYYERTDQKERDQVITSTTLVLALVAWSVCGLALLFSDTLAALFIGRKTAEVSATQITQALQLMLVLIPFQLTTLSGMYYLQALKRSGLYSTIQTTKLLVEVAAHIVLMGVYDYGLNGFLLGMVIGEALTTLSLTGWMLVKLRPRIRWSVFRPVLAYAAPLIPVGLFQLGLHQVDRRLLEYSFTGAEGLALTGIYGLGYKIGYLVNAVMLGPFMQIWQPWIYGVKDAAERATLVARVSTYAVLAIAAASLASILFGRQAIDLLRGSEEYAGAYVVIPWIATGYVFWALYNASQIPLFIAKRTRPLLWINLVALAFNVAVNLLLIPRFGIVGAAATTLLSFMLLAGLGILVSRSEAHVPFEGGRLARTLAVVVLGGATAIWLDSFAYDASLGSAAAVLGAKALALLLLLASLWRFVLDAEERDRGRSWLQGRLARSS